VVAVVLLVAGKNIPVDDMDVLVIEVGVVPSSCTPFDMYAGPPKI
jgi:hypothetical protein